MSNTKIGAKEKIINAAWELFREKGYEETTLQAIRKRRSSFARK